VEYVVIEFPGNNFSGEIIPAIADLVERRLVRILDLVFVARDDDGAVVAFEFDQLEESALFEALEGEAGSVFSENDVLEIAESIEPGSSALFIVWEDLWAADFGAAVRHAGGEVRLGGRIPYQLIADVFSPTDTQTDAEELSS
jgi:uncharacterized membrane protein